jgi:hypothetical protein
MLRNTDLRLQCVPHGLVGRYIRILACIRLQLRRTYSARRYNNMYSCRVALGEEDPPEGAALPEMRRTVRNSPMLLTPTQEFEPFFILIDASNSAEGATVGLRKGMGKR